MPYAIEAENLEKTFGGDVHALDGVSFAVDEGSVFGLLGPNRAGNTTLIHILCTTMALDSRRVTVAGEEVHLAPKEFEVLRHLIANIGKPVTHRRLLQIVWGPEYGEETENLRVVINQLRKKIEKDPSQPKFILTEPWVGYRFQPPKGPTSKTPARK